MCAWCAVCCFSVGVYHRCKYPWCTNTSVGCGDTATIMVLSEELDIDVFLYTPPDQRLATTDLPKIFRPLLFRRSTHPKAAAPAPNRMVLRYKEGHFICQSKFGDSTERHGQLANHEHYLTGTHDVATGRCVLCHVYYLRY